MATISELIQSLQTLQNTYGDLEVVNGEDEAVEVEFNDDSDDPVVVIG